MNPSQVTNSMLVEQFNVSIIDGDFKATNSKGRVQMITDLRAKYVKLSKNKKLSNQLASRTPEARAKSKLIATQEKSNANNAAIIDALAVIRQQYISDNRADVMIRQTQPGIDFNSLGIKAYYNISTSKKIVMNLSSVDFNGKDLSDLYANYDLFKDTQAGVTIANITIEESFEIIDRLVSIIEKF